MIRILLKKITQKKRMFRFKHFQGYIERSYFKKVKQKLHSWANTVQAVGHRVEKKNHFTGKAPLF